MKKYLFLLCSLVISSVAFAANSENASVTSLKANTLSESFLPVCKFSISKPTGVIYDTSSGGTTYGFSVLLSCPQEKDVTATVSVHIGKDIVANEIVTIKAGQKSEICKGINVNREYVGQKYYLTVE